VADDTPPDWRQLETFSFGDNPALADELADLVLRGLKRATCWAASQGPLTALKIAAVTGQPAQTGVAAVIEAVRPKRK
jgi:uncharacterized protein YhfF